MCPIRTQNKNRPGATNTEAVKGRSAGATNTHRAIQKTVIHHR